jgi:hypothetical protein
MTRRERGAIMRKSNTVSFFGTLAMLVTSAPAIVISTYPQAVMAQTQGMERREDRRTNRQDAREDKHACNASGDSSRAECRQTKREDKQTGRQGDSLATQPVTRPATPGQ